MNDSELINKTAEHVKQKFLEEHTGHDWWHMYRVWQLAKHIAKNEKNVDMAVVELGALLHDIADFKFHGGDLEAGPRAARKWLESLNVEEKTIAHIEDILRNISFKGYNIKNIKSEIKTIEGKIIFDADKLDSIGAIGIARVFAYTGAHCRPIHTPGEKLRTYSSTEEYVASRASAILHFDEKLLHLKDIMFTKTGRELAENRHKYMEDFLNEFHSEWEGKT